MDEPLRESVIFNARLHLNLTTTEAGMMVGVTKRTWEYWEAGVRKMPSAAFELFLAKLDGSVRTNIKYDESYSIVTIFAKDRVTPIDAVSNQNFLSLTISESTDTAVICSLAVERGTGKRYKYSTAFSISANDRVIPKVNEWKNAIAALERS